MSDPSLSTEDIDALIQAAQSNRIDSGAGSASVKAVKPYDFVRPEKFSKDQLRALETIHVGCAKGLSGQLTTLLRTPAVVEMTSVSEVASQDFLGSLSESDTLALFRLKPLEGRSYLTYDAGLTFALVDRRLGGPGAIPGEVRVLTDIEKALMVDVSEKILHALADAWKHVTPLTPEVDSLGNGGHTGLMSMAKESLIRVSFTVRFGTVMGDVRILIPLSSLEPILPKLKPQPWGAAPAFAADETVTQSLRHSLDRAQVEMAVELGSAEVTLRDILELQTGDVIMLNRRAGSDLDLRVGDDVKFRGQPGLVGRKLGFQITHVVKEES